MAQENQTIADYHTKHNTPVKKYHAIQMICNLTNRKRWGIFWFGDNGVMYERFPVSYGMRAAVRLANRLNREYKKRMVIVTMARNSFTTGV